MFSSFQCRSGRTRLVRFGDIAWTALKASEKIRKPFESWIKALGNKGGPFLRDEFCGDPKKPVNFNFRKHVDMFIYVFYTKKHVEYISVCFIISSTPKSNCLFLGRKCCCDFPPLKSGLQWLPWGLGLRCFRVLLGEIENLDLDAAPGAGGGDGGDGMGWSPGLVGLVDVEMNFRVLLKWGDMYMYVLYMNNISTDYTI